jgi:hypothetical protein
MPVCRLLAAPLALAAAFGMSACGSVGTQIPPSLGGLPPEAPPRPAVQSQFPNVYDTPPVRPAKLMSEQEQAKTEAELAAVRNRVNATAEALQKEPIDPRR